VGYSPLGTTLPPVPSLEEAPSSNQSSGQEVVEKPPTFLTFPVSIPNKVGAQANPEPVSSNKRKFEDTLQYKGKPVGKGGKRDLLILILSHRYNCTVW